MTTIANLSSLRAAVRDRMARSDLSDTLIDGHVKLVEAHIRRKLDLLGLDTEIDYPISTSIQDLPDNYEELKYIRTTGDDGCNLTAKTQSNAMKFRDDAAASPRHYLLLGNLNGATQIEFLPRPSGTFSARLGYQTRAELASDGDFNNVITDHPDIYLNGCLHYAYLHLQDAETAMMYGGFFETALDEATSDDVMSRWGDGPLLPSAAYVEGSVRK